MESAAAYRGPFMAYWNDTGRVMISSSMDVSSRYAGSLCAPNGFIVQHIAKNSVDCTPGSPNSLIVLKADWEYSASENLRYSFELVPDPWKTYSETEYTIIADTLNPVTEEYPNRNPYIGIFPIARVKDSGEIEQLQFGHIVDYGRWWRI